MTTFHTFKLDCFIIDGGLRVNKTAYLNPSFVCGLERDKGLTTVITTEGKYYTALPAELIIEGLKSTQERNHGIVMSN